MSSRSQFIRASSFLLGISSVVQPALPAPAAEPDSAELRWAFDKNRFDGILSNKAQHKQCFGAATLANGEVLTSIQNSYIAYVSYYPDESFQAIGVLYHGTAIALAMNDDVWNNMLIPGLRSSEPRDEISLAQPGAGNPYLKRAFVRKRLRKDTSLFVCHNAIVGFTYRIAQSLREAPQKVHDALVVGIVDGGLVVPAGVMAINACQEAKFTYIQTSV